MQLQLRIGVNGNNWLVALFPHSQVVPAGVHSQSSNPSPSKTAQVGLLHGGQVQELDQVPSREGDGV